MGRLPGPLRGSHPTALDPGQPRLQLLLPPTRPTTRPAPDTAPLSGTRARTPVLGATAATDPLLPDPASGPGPTRTDRCPQSEHPRNHPAVHHSRRRDRPEPLPAPVGRGTEPEPITTDHRCSAWVTVRWTASVQDRYAGRCGVRERADVCGAGAPARGEGRHDRLPDGAC